MCGPSPFNPKERTRSHRSYTAHTKHAGNKQIKRKIGPQGDEVVDEQMGPKAQDESMRWKGVLQARVRGATFTLIA